MSTITDTPVVTTGYDALIAKLSARKTHRGRPRSSASIDIDHLVDTGDIFHEVTFEGLDEFGRNAHTQAYNYVQNARNHVKRTGADIRISQDNTTVLVANLTDLTPEQRKNVLAKMR